MSTTSAAEFYGHVTAYAPGKVHLTLAVGPLEDDGYHTITTVMLALSLGDEVTATARHDGEISLSLSDDSTGVLDMESLPEDDANLAVRAAHVLRSHLRLDENTHGVHLELTKHLPAAGGLGGRAADAAAALLACAGLWEAGLSRQELATIGQELSSEVPFAIMGGAAVGTHRGEILTPILTRQQLHLVIVPAMASVSTSYIYSSLDRLRAEGALDTRQTAEIDRGIIEAMMHGDADQLALMMHNDLQVPVTALVPELSDVLDVGMSEGALTAMVSGAGPTTVYLAHDAEDASQLASRIQERTGIAALTVSGPRPGARIR